MRTVGTKSSCVFSKPDHIVDFSDFSFSRIIRLYVRMLDVQADLSIPVTYTA